MSAEARGILVVFADLINWLKMYRERAFWYQIFATILGVLLWFLIAGILVHPISLAIIILIDSIMTNIFWASLRKPYSCVIGGSVGNGLYNFVAGALFHKHSGLEIVNDLVLGVVHGFVFTWFAFIIFYSLGLIKLRKKSEE
ncbi:MAG: hypothetical protein JSW13_01880 [Candidatus Aerophobus sp.]|nr:MAG: hypothetical protein JSW13_01880 [Candidatus Aerophobus sp.]